ncbi:MAG: hypothetical protein OEW18_00230 [Candidatus Aminicenantes bacterium]|nr:hypothetical protein [Candidatus Aminicenantes bacterium]
MGTSDYSLIRNRIFPMLLSGGALLCGSFFPQEIPLRLAGQAKFPSSQAISWQQTQADVTVSAEDKIKSTIDTYFIIINESLKALELFDFGFLFDLNDVKAWNDYAYERGFMYVRIEADKEMDMPLTSYVYKPEYYSINVNGASADIKMRGWADWIIKKLRERAATNSPWSEHDFRLVLINGQWKIKRVHCPDPDHNVYPRDTDFNKKAEEAVQSLKRLKKHFDP